MIKPFANLCAVADRNNLQVEIWTNDDGAAIWVVDEGNEFEINGVTNTMRRAVVASPFWNIPFDAAAPQLISMLAARGYK